MRYFRVIFLALLFAFLCTDLEAQPCDSITPSFIVDLSADPDSVWFSPEVVRDGLCCSAAEPDGCIEFFLTLNSNTVGIRLDIVSGAQPTGSMFFEVECANPTEVGDTLCVSGPGPHRITFCKPGGNKNVYSITAINRPGISGPIYVGDGCIDTLSVYGLEESTITWSSFPYNAAYNAYLSCTMGCDTTIVIGDAFAPDSIVYTATGLLKGACAGDTWVTDTAVVYFISDKYAEILPDDPAVCFGGTDATISADCIGGYPPYNYIWSTGETTSSIDVGVGTYWVEITDISDCPPVYDTVTVTAYTLPIQADAGPDIVVCSDDGLVYLSGSVQMASGGVWSGGAGSFNPSPDSLICVYTPTAAEIAGDSIILSLLTTGTGGCPPHTDYITIHFSPTAEADFSFINECIGASMDFTNTSTYSSSVTQQWSWDFGDGTTASTFDASHTFSTFGIYTVQLSLQSDGMCFDTVQYQVYIAPPASADFTYDDQCINDPVNFTDNSSVASGSIVSWQWSFGDSSTSSEQNPLHQYSSVGNYIVSLTVTTDNGCIDSVSYPINFVALPDVQIFPENPAVCYGMSNAELSAVPSGGVPPYSYQWNTGSTDTLIIVGAGTYWVELHDLSNCGTIRDSVVVVEFFEPISANAGPDKVICSEDGVVLLEGYVQGVTTGLWSGGNGAFSPSEESLICQYLPTATEIMSGTLTLTLTTTGNANCTSDSDDIIIRFSPYVSADFSYTKACEGQNMVFTNTSVYNSGVTQVWSWDFGDATTSSLHTPIPHQYSDFGTYVVSLDVVSDSKCYDTVKKTVYVGTIPVVDFQTDGHCLNDPVYFTDLSTNLDGPIVMWSWDFGDGITSSEQNPEHLFASSGGYLISLIVESDSGCVASLVEAFEISPAFPEAKFNPSAYIVRPGIEVTFTNLSNNAMIWNWDFGDNAGTSTMQNPTYAWADTGVYTVELSVADMFDCRDTTSHDILVQLPPLMPNAFSPNGDGANDILFVTGGPFAEFELQIYNQWGELIYVSKDQNLGWDGMKDGVKQPMGVYVYTVIAVSLTGEKLIESGDVTLLR